MQDDHKHNNFLPETRLRFFARKNCQYAKKKKVPSNDYYALELVEETRVYSSEADQPGKYHHGCAYRGGLFDLLLCLLRIMGLTLLLRFVRISNFQY